MKFGKLAHLRHDATLGLGKYRMDPEEIRARASC